MPDKASTKYPRIYLRVSQYELRKFIEFKEKYGLSARDVLAYSGCPCDKCKGQNVVIYDKENGEEINIPRGILSKRDK